MEGQCCMLYAGIEMYVLSNVFWWLFSGFLLDKKVGVNQPKRVENARILIANTQMDADKIKVDYCVFYPNMTTLRPGICRHNSICLSVCLSVYDIHAPYSADWNFPQCFHAILWPPCKILWRSSQRNPSIGG